VAKEFTLLLLINSLFIIGLYKITDKGMIFSGFRTWLVRKLGRSVAKPFIDCPPCMSSFWGLVFFVAYFGLFYILLLPVYCICLAGLVTLLMRFADYEI